MGAALIALALTARCRHWLNAIA